MSEGASIYKAGAYMAGPEHETEVDQPCDSCGNLTTLKGGGHLVVDLPDGNTRWYCWPSRRCSRCGRRYENTDPVPRMKHAQDIAISYQGPPDDPVYDAEEIK